MRIVHQLILPVMLLMMICAMKKSFEQNRQRLGWSRTISAVQHQSTSNLPTMLKQQTPPKLQTIFLRMFKAFVNVSGSVQTFRFVSPCSRSRPLNNIGKPSRENWSLHQALNEMIVEILRNNRLVF